MPQNSYFGQSSEPLCFLLGCFLLLRLPVDSLPPVQGCLLLLGLYNLALGCDFCSVMCHVTALRTYTGLGLSSLQDVTFF